MVAKQPGPLLIVDDRADVRRSLKRYLGLHFAEVLVAGTPDEVEKVLRDVQLRLLLCDYWLGPDYPPATELIPNWRKICPTLVRVAVMSGTDPSPQAPCSAIDVVFQKPLDMHRVVEFLREIV